MAVTAALLAISVLGLRWYLNPRIKLSIFNESSTSIYDLRVSFLGGERTLHELKPGKVAVSEIRSGGDAGIDCWYRDRLGNLLRVSPIYYESGNRGFLEIHVSRDVPHIINGIYALDAPRGWWSRGTDLEEMSVQE
jgi:hypothetical protein